nr:serine protease [uncultured Roseibium sp.]
MMTRKLTFGALSVATAMMMMFGQASAQETFYCETSDGRATSRIIGGSETSIQEFPWTVSLSAPWGGAHKGHFCGASLISKRWILTASHCFFDQNGDVISPDEIKVHVGGTEAASGKEFGIEKIIVHEHYNPQTSENDIALIRVDSPVDTPSARPINLTSQKLDRIFARVSVCTTVVGWGVTEAGQGAKNLQEVSLPIISNETCRASYPNEVIDETQICAAYSDGQRDSCSGDSGGPLVVEIGNTGNFVQVGVVSWGYGCAEKGHPGVYARVAAYIDWIKEKTGSN